MRYARAFCVPVLLQAVLIAPALFGQMASQPANGFALMTANQFRSAGLGKLSQDELDYLNQWLQTYTIAWMETGARIAQDACQRKAEAALAQAVQPAHIATLDAHGARHVADSTRSVGQSSAITQTKQEVVRATNEASVQAAQQTAENRRLLAQRGQYCAFVQLDPEEMKALLVPATSASIKQ